MLSDDVIAKVSNFCHVRQKQVGNCVCVFDAVQYENVYIHTHVRLTALCPGLPGWAGTRKVKPIWILLKQETVSGNCISWAICKSAPLSRQITMPARHHSVFYRLDALPVTQPTASKHWRQKYENVYIVHKLESRCVACLMYCMGSCCELA